MARLFKKKPERKKGIWRRVVDLALTDVRVVAGGIDEASLGELEEKLLAADFGVPATMRLTDRAEQSLRRGESRGADGLGETLKSEIAEILQPATDAHLNAAESGLTVYLIVGVNGVGKTTTVAEARRLPRAGRAERDGCSGRHLPGRSGRAARGVGDRTGADFLRGQQGGDPAAVAFDALDAAEARGTEVVLIDTAGRLHTNRGLMEELSKIDRVVRRRIEGAPHETLMVLDATVGQNAVRQVEAFSQAVAVSGLILAKMDSSARGGIVVALQEEYGIPVKLIGTGEGLGDLESFDAGAFVEAVFA